LRLGARHEPDENGQENADQTEQVAPCATLSPVLAESLESGRGGHSRVYEHQVERLSGKFSNAGKSLRGIYRESDNYGTGVDGQKTPFVEQ